MHRYWWSRFLTDVLQILTQFYVQIQVIFILIFILRICEDNLYFFHGITYISLIERCSMNAATEPYPFDN